MRGRWLALAMALVVSVGVAACGDGGDDGGDVAADTAAEPAACSPVGEDIQSGAARTVDVVLDEFSFTPATITVAPGITTFAARNQGTENHEVAFLPGGGEVPFTPGGEPDEEALEAQGAFELEAFGPGLDCTATYDLRPGTYTLFCIVTSADGTTHYENGMRGLLTVA